MTSPTQPLAPAPTSDPAERHLFSFGPFGVSISRGRPSLWTKTLRNVIEVVLTDRRLCGVWQPRIFPFAFGRKKGQVYFSIPLTSIVGAELTRLAATRVLYVRYREGEAIEEICVEAALGLHQHVEHLHEQLRARGIAVS